MPIKPEGSAAGVVRLCIGNETTDYVITERPEKNGRRFTLAKVDGDAEYNVVLGSPNRCDCPGNERWGKCKHVEALAALVAAGRL
jgi:hypothetical protein